MSEQKLTSDQQKRIGAIMEEWAEEIKRIPEPPKGYYGGGFNCKKATERQKPYEDLRDKYLPMIQAIKEENNGEE